MRAGTLRRRSRSSAWAVAAAGLVFGLSPGVVRGGPPGPADPDRLQDELERARAAVDAGDLDAALGSYRAAVAAGAKQIDEELAQLYFALGERSYARGEYGAALAYFQDAQSYYPSPVFHYNIAQCYEQLEKYEQAIDSFKAYLRGEPEAPDRPNVEKRIERLERLIALRAEERERARNEPVAPVTGDPEPSRRRPPPPPGVPMMAIGGTIGGLGLITAAAGGAIFGVRAADRSKQVDAVFSGGNPERLTLAETRALDRDGRTAQRNQWITIGVGGAGVVVGAVLMAVGAKRYAAAKGERAALSPILGPSTAGLSLSGRF